MGSTPSVAAMFVRTFFEPSMMRIVLAISIWLDCMSGELSCQNEFTATLPSNRNIRERINTHIDDLHFANKDGERVPYVCTICDEYILNRNDVEKISVKKMKEAAKILSWDRLEATERISDLEVKYCFQQDIPSEKDSSWLKGLALSPRGCVFRESTRSDYGFSSCRRCKESLDAKQIPMYAISNKNFIGCAPPELTSLNDVERAFLTPIHSYGYCFTYMGGKMMNIKGQLTFMRVTPRQIAKSVTTLECMGLTKHVIVLLSGKMTLAQKEKIKQQTTVRTEKLIDAVKWLIHNHKSWKNVNLEELKDAIGRTKPIRVDKTTNVQSGNSSVEEEVMFTCYFPDGKNNAFSGGFENPHDFKEFVDKMNESNFDVHFKSEVEREFLNGKDGDQLIGACPIQFPYGIGGVHEKRELPDGSFSSKADLGDFLQHLSRKSQTEFQTPLFQLIMYSMLSRARLLRSARLQLKNKVSAAELANGFDAKDFSKAAKARSS